MKIKNRFRSEPRIILNDDAETILTVPQPHNEERVYTAVDYLKNTPVDILCFCLGEQSMAYSYLSERVESVMGKLLKSYGRRKKRGTVESDGLPENENLALSLYKKGIDYLPILIDRTHNLGIQFFGSFRMNDCHLRSAPSGLLSAEFWKRHQKYRLWSFTEAQHYYSAALDYSYPEVRENYLVMIKEVVEKYDIDGIELDFGRNPYLFQRGEGWKKRYIMDEFINSISKILDSTGKQKSKKIKLLLRIVFNRDLQKNAGMDIESWLKKGYIDILVMTNWSSSTTNDNNILIEYWLGLCKKYNVLFYPSVECVPALNNRENISAMIPNPLIPAYNNRFPASKGIVKPEEKKMEKTHLFATAQNYYGQGAKGIYLFNFVLNFTRLRFEKKDTKKLKFWLDMLHQLGDKGKLEKIEKRYLFWPECPVCVDSLRPPDYHQTIKFNIFDPALKRKDIRVILSFRQVAEKHPHTSEDFFQNPVVPAGWVKYYLNGKLIEEKYIHRSRRPAGRIPSQFILREHELITLTLPPRYLTFGENLIAFYIPKFPEARDPYIYIHELTVDIYP